MEAPQLLSRGVRRRAVRRSSVVEASGSLGPPYMLRPPEPATSLGRCPRPEGPLHEAAAGGTQLRSRGAASLVRRVVTGWSWASNGVRDWQITKRLREEEPSSICEPVSSNLDQSNTFLFNKVVRRSMAKIAPFEVSVHVLSYTPVEYM